MRFAPVSRRTRARRHLLIDANGRGAFTVNNVTKVVSTIAVIGCDDNSDSHSKKKKKEEKPDHRWSERASGASVPENGRLAVRCLFFFPDGAILLFRRNGRANGTRVTAGVGGVRDEHVALTDGSSRLRRVSPPSAFGGETRVGVGRRVLIGVPAVRSKKITYKTLRPARV